MARSSQVAWSAPECHRHEHHHQQHIAGTGRARRHRHRRHRRLTGTSRFTGFVGDFNIGFKYWMKIWDLNIGCTEKNSQKTYRMRILAESSAHCSDLCFHCKIVPFHLFVRVDTGQIFKSLLDLQSCGDSLLTWWEADPKF